MAARRTLVEGMKAPQADRLKEKAFVYGKPEVAMPEKPKAPKAKAEPKQKRERPKVAKPEPAPKEEREGGEPTPTLAPPAVPASTGRTPLTTKIRSNLATALKRASLERQLANEKPNTVQDILEEALEPWLKEKGYLKD